MAFARLAIAAGALLTMLASAACGGGSSYGTSTASTPASTKASASSSGSPASSGTQKQLTITAQDFSFSADAVNVAKGDTIAITFKNSGSANHTLAFYSDAAYQNRIAGADTGSVGGGALKALTVTVGDGLYYLCNIHPAQMHGEIEITTTQAPGQTQLGTPTADARSAPVETPTRSPGAATEGQPPAPAGLTVPTQAPVAAPTPIPTIAPAPTRAAATVPSKPYAPPSYNY